MILLKLKCAACYTPIPKIEDTKKIDASAAHETLSILRNWVCVNICQPNRKKGSHLTQFVYSQKHFQHIPRAANDTSPSSAS